MMLWFCRSAPKLLRKPLAACCVDHELLRKFDDQMRSAVCSICNVSLTDDQWPQASAPVRNGGLGLRHVSSLVLSAFLASAAGTRKLQDHILHRVSLVNDGVFDSCLLTRVNNGTQPPVDSYSHKQRTWDKVVVDAEYRDLLNRYSEPYHRMRLLAAAGPHSGDWLHILHTHISARGLHLEDNAVSMWLSVYASAAQSVRLTHLHVVPRWILLVSMRYHAR